MPKTATPTFHSQQARFAGWMAVAVLLHALLLCIPVRQSQSTGTAAKSLAVVLTDAWRPAPPSPAKDRSPAEPASALPQQQSAPEPRPLPTPTLPARAAARSGPPAGEETSAPADRSTPHALTAARLLDLANRREWRPRAESDTRRLGAFSPRRPPENWRSGSLPEPGLINAAAPPPATQIVDRWLAADGSHNVMLRTPGGETFCGRAEAWNPLSPLVEPVMTYRPCGGVRTFEMPERFRPGAGNAGRR